MKKSILRSLLACSILSSANVYGAATVIGDGVTQTVNAPGVHPTDYRFWNGAAPSTGTLNFDADVFFTGELQDATSGKLQLQPGHTLHIANGESLLNVGNIEIFDAANTIFAINNPGITTTISSSWTRVPGGWQGSSIQFLTDSIVTDPSLRTAIGASNMSALIGANNSPASLQFSHSVNGTVNMIYFADVNSRLIFDSSNSAGATLKYSTGTFGGFLSGYAGTHAGLAGADNAGIVNINAQNKNIVLEGAMTAFGTGPNNRIKSLEFIGNSEATLNSRFYSKELILNSSSSVTVSDDSNMGSEGTISVQQDSNLLIKDWWTGNDWITTEEGTLNLGTNHLKLSDGTLQFTKSATVNLEFDDVSGNFGKISVGGGAENAKLDISNLNKLKVNFTGTTEKAHMDTVNKGEISLPVFTADANGTIDDTGTIVEFKASEANAFVTWNYDAASHTIKSSTDWNGLLNIVDPPAPAPAPAPAAAPVPAPVIEIINEITKNALSAAEKVKIGNSVITDNELASAFFIRAIGSVNDAAEIKEIALALAPKKSHIPDDGVYETDESIKLRLSSVNEPPVGIEQGGVYQPDVPGGSPAIPAAAAADGNPLGYGIAAGDDISTKYGLWATPFVHRAFQKKL